MAENTLPNPLNNYPLLVQQPDSHLQNREYGPPCPRWLKGKPDLPIWLRQLNWQAKVYPLEPTAEAILEWLQWSIKQIGKMIGTLSSSNTEWDQYVDNGTEEVEHGFKLMDGLREEGFRGLPAPIPAIKFYSLEDARRDLWKMLDAVEGKNKPKSKTIPDPVKQLTNWREITDALDLRHNEREKVKSLNERFCGPIPKPGKGSQPIVDKNELIEWWNKLAVRQQELANSQNGAKLSAEALHSYGREGTVAPEIKGGVKNRRKDRK